MAMKNVMLIEMSVENEDDFLNNMQRIYIFLQAFMKSMMQ